MKDSQELKHEAIEYRIKRTRQILFWAVGVLMMSMAFVSYFNSPSWLGIGICTFVYLLGLLVVGNSSAQATDGLLRNAYGRWVNYSDPPLDEWEDYLEERGAFGGDDVSPEDGSE